MGLNVSKCIQGQKKIKINSKNISHKAGLTI